MNITDISARDGRSLTWAEKLSQIFARQTELMEKYRHIEQLPEAPLPLHHHLSQRILKDFER